MACRREAFDCSGLTMRSWEAAGPRINRSSRDQYRQVYKITYDSMRTGGLIFWGDAGEPKQRLRRRQVRGERADRRGAPGRDPAAGDRYTVVEHLPFAGRP